MAACNKFHSFVDYLVGNVKGQAIAFGSDTFKAMLTNVAPIAKNKKYSDIAASELAAGDGYVKGGAVVKLSAANAAGIETVTAEDVTFASTGIMGPFRYAVLYDATPTDKPLICWLDYDSPVVLKAKESIVIELKSSAPNEALFTFS